MKLIKKLTVEFSRFSRRKKETKSAELRLHASKWDQFDCNVTSRSYNNLNYRQSFTVISNTPGTSSNFFPLFPHPPVSLSISLRLRGLSHRFPRRVSQLACRSSRDRHPACDCSFRRKRPRETLQRQTIFHRRGRVVRSREMKTKKRKR